MSQDNSTNTSDLILVTGATGYIGGRLIPLLLEAGYRVRAASRSIQKLKNRPWANHSNVELLECDVLEQDQVSAALKNCSAVYYLVHSMLPGQKDFASADKKAAEIMRKQCTEENIKQLIYLGGLGDQNPDLSKHLASRLEVAEILAKGKTPVTTLKAAMIIGSGSASFEILRYLVDRLPFMITPKWLETRSQPIAVRNVLNYLVGCLHKEETYGRSFDIGGLDVLTYHELMSIYAEEAGLRKRIVLPVPVLTPRLSSYWIHLVTPVPASLARPLAEGLKNPVVCKENDIQKIIPQNILNCRDAIRLALKNTSENAILSHWTDAGKLPPVERAYPGDPDWAGGAFFKDVRSEVTETSIEKVWNAIESIGGERGWYHADWLWALRGELDKLFGGVGLRRGRRDSQHLIAGDALDFWRVLEVRKNQSLVLIAEMKLPGKALLKFEISKTLENKTQVTQTAQFQPKGLWGIIYWYSVFPLHSYIFPGMLKKMILQASQ